ncbi:MAG TPA: hypothetical protein ENJ28_03055 [Gammaproteobacteria bacterium]|nr:hypothetical protein [Gammaproteobacteria bacterium]
MREKVAAILFIVILAFLAVFSAEIFHKIFIEADDKFTASASAAFLGAFLAFIFVRLGDFFKSYSDRTTKSHSALIKLEHTLNGLLTTLDDNIYVIETFEKIYKDYTENEKGTYVFVWANRLHPVAKLDELILELLNIDLINELFMLNVHLRKLNESMDTINDAYAESKDALIGGRIDPENYMANAKRIHTDLLDIKRFLMDSIEETTKSLAAVRVLARKRPLLGYLLRRIAGHKYGPTFNAKRSEEIVKLRHEMETVKSEGQERINEVLARKNNDS